MGGTSPATKFDYITQRCDGLFPKLQISWEGPCEAVTRINDVIYRIQKLSRAKPRVVHFNNLVLFAGSNDEKTARVRHVSPSDSELSFEEFMLLWSNGQKAHYGQQISECPEGMHLPSRRRLDSWRSNADKNHWLDESFRSLWLSKRKRGPSSIW
ncbi:hypothetical protein NQ318_018082 [Aromia moschata]|uniref:Integrase p58-like C-terminal domain-containing protein n=1 Tax=Aromia moschata TaxID=1265417 RepID=A0AAV8ZD70_9CUCU|nr:hypothetical protein NQ318_018082 [Aromia moschata]